MSILDGNPQGRVVFSQGPPTVRRTLVVHRAHVAMVEIGVPDVRIDEAPCAIAVRHAGNDDSLIVPYLETRVADEIYLSIVEEDIDVFWTRLENPSSALVPIWIRVPDKERLR